MKQCKGKGIKIPMKSIKISSKKLNWGNFKTSIKNDQ